MSVALRDIAVLAGIFGFIAIYTAVLLLAAEGAKQGDRKEEGK